MNCQHLTSKGSRNTHSMCVRCTNPVSTEKMKKCIFYVFSCWVLGKNSVTNELSMVKVTISVKINHNKDPFPKERTPRTPVFVENLNYRVYCTGELNPIQWGLNVSPGREIGNCCNRWEVQNFHSQNDCITYVESGNYT